MMAISSASAAGKECWKGFLNNVGNLVNETVDALERGERKCQSSDSGAHDWQYKRSIVVQGEGWHECSRCKAEK